MNEDQADLQTTNDFSKTLNHSALVIILFRVVLAVVFVLTHHWPLVVAALIGVCIWFWIFFDTQKRSRRFTFFLSLIESVFLFTYTVVSVGWNSGMYFSLIILYPLVMINENLKLIWRVIISAALTGILAGLFILARRLGLDQTTPENYQNILFFTNLIQGYFLLILTTFTLESEKQSSEARIVNDNQHLLTLANTDPLTNLLNRRNMMAQIETEKEKIEKGGQPFSLIMIDVDNFKQINDEYGHDGCDFVLVLLSEKIKSAVRKRDFISRWGGDEFLIMLIETDLSTGEIVAEKVRLNVVNSPFIYQDINIPVTITLGISQCGVPDAVSGCIHKADLALYEGKQAGKNRSVRMK